MRSDMFCEHCSEHDVVRGNAGLGCLLVVILAWLVLLSLILIELARLSALSPFDLLRRIFS